MSYWLNSFAYRIDTGPWTFVIAITMTMVLEVVVISYQSIRSVVGNPANSLRKE